VNTSLEALAPLSLRLKVRQIMIGRRACCEQTHETG
jgi:hypothetical protein